MKIYGKLISVANKNLPDNRRTAESTTNCLFCNRTFSTRRNCTSHMKQCCMGGVTDKSNNYKYRCFSCDQRFSSLVLKDKHSSVCTGWGISDGNIEFDVLKGKTFQDTTFEYFVVPRDPFINHLTNFSLWKMILTISPVISHFQRRHEKYPALKINAILVSDFFPSQDLQIRQKDAIRVKDSQIFLRSLRTYPCYPATNVVDDVLEPMFHDLILRCDNFEHRGSGWRIRTFTRLEICINVSNPLRVAACGDNEHVLPLNLAKKHALLQVKYGDHKGIDCFIWTVYAAVYYMCHKQKKEQQQQQQQDFEEISVEDFYRRKQLSY